MGFLQTIGDYMSVEFIYLYWMCNILDTYSANNWGNKKSCCKKNPAAKKSFLLQVRQYLNGMCPNQKMCSIGKDKNY